MMATSMRRLITLAVLSGLLSGGAAHADDLPEYRLKAAFIYNFAVYTEWPADTGATLTLCIHGQDPFGKDIDALQARAVGTTRTLAVQRRASGESLKGCQLVFFPPSSMEALPRLLESLRGQTVLTVADSAGAMRRGVALNMAVVNHKVSFEANLVAARGAGITLSSKLLRLATEVLQ